MLAGSWPRWPVCRLLPPWNVERRCCRASQARPVPTIFADPWVVLFDRAVSAREATNTARVQITLVAMSGIPRPPGALVCLPQPPGERQASQESDSIQVTTELGKKRVCFCIGGVCHTTMLACCRSLFGADRAPPMRETSVRRGLPSPSPACRPCFCAYLNYVTSHSGQSTSQKPFLCRTPKLSDSACRQRVEDWVPDREVAPREPDVHRRSCPRPGRLPGSCLCR